MHFTHGHQSCQKIRLLLGIGLASDTFVAFTGSAGFVGVDSGDQDQLILHLFVNSCKAVYIIAYGILIVSRAGSDDHQKFITLTGEDISDLGVSFFFDLD